MITRQQQRIARAAARLIEPEHGRDVALSAYIAERHRLGLPVNTNWSRWVLGFGPRPQLDESEGVS